MLRIFSFKISIESEMSIHYILKKVNDGPVQSTNSEELDFIQTKCCRFRILNPSSDISFFVLDIGEEFSRNRNILTATNAN